MKRISHLVLLFAVLFAVLIVGPGLLNRQFGPYPLIKTGDVLDLFAPLILIPLYWALFQVNGERNPSRGQVALFLILAACWVEGQGMHLAANSIGHLLDEMKGSDVYTLTLFYDEVLSHYLWHSAIVGLSALILYRQWKNPFAGEYSGLGLQIAAGVVHGFNYFLTIVEGATGPLGVPFAALVTIMVLVWGRKRLRQQPLLTFFFAAYLVATLFFAGWAIYWGGLPEFSQVGIID